MLKINTKFKNTEVGPIPEEWGIKYFSDVFEITSSKRIFMSEYVSSGVPFFRGKEIIEKAKGNKKVSTSLYITEERFNKIASIFGAPCENDILMSSVGTIGVPYLVSRGEKFYFKDGNLTWFKNFSKNICQKFIYYWLISPVGTQNILASAIGSTQQALTIDGLRKNFIPLPPISEQKQIAEILSSLDDKIELNRKINENLEKIASILFKHWFVEFEFPDKNGKPYKSNSGKMVDSELGPIPEELNITKAVGVFAFDMGIEPGSKNYQVSHIDLLPFYRVKDLFNGNSSDVFVQKDLVKNRICNHEDVLISLDGSIGRVATGISGAYSSGVYKIYANPNYNFIKNSFIYFYLKSDYIQNLLREYTQGTTIMHASHAIEHMDVATDENLILGFQQLVDPMFNLIIKNLKEINYLSQIRDFLLPKLMSGKIRV